MSFLKRMSRRDLILAATFITVDAVAIAVVANYYMGSELWERNPAAETPRDHEREARTLERIQKAADSGSWDTLEDTRRKLEEEWRGNRLQPGRGLALYFFPSALGRGSLEVDFSQNEIQPGLKQLEQAHRAGERERAANAFRLLSTRVKNFELGAVTSDEELSPEARTFLKAYGNVTSGGK